VSHFEQTVWQTVYVNTEFTYMSAVFIICFSYFLYIFMDVSIVLMCAVSDLWKHITPTTEGIIY